MKKNKLYLFLAIITSLLLFITAAICNQCQATQAEETLQEETEEEAVPKEVEEKATEEEMEEEVVEEEIAEEEATEEEEEKVTEAEELETPTINIQIYSGPTYSTVDGVCYYRIEAIVTGSPNPTVSFSKDDSGGAWGSKKVQINLNNPGDTYTLTATATNSEGTATDSLTLTWGCEEEIIEEDGDEEELVFEGYSLDELEGDFIFDKVILHPTDIGYIVYPSGINTETLIFGDSISNAEVHGYFGWADLSPLSGREIETVTLRMDAYKIWGTVGTELCLKVDIGLSEDDIFPLDTGDWAGTVVAVEKFAPVDEPMIWSDDPLRIYIFRRARDGERADFIVYMDAFRGIDNYQIDGKEYLIDNISLIVEFAD